MKFVNNENKVPIKSWCEEVEDKAMEQTVNLANHPTIFRHVALMPDCHFGYGMPIGGVVALDNAVIPNATGVDIGCGMGAIETNLDANNITKPQLREIINNVKSLVPVGFNRHSEQSDQYKSNYSFFEKYLENFIDFDK